MRRRTRIGFVDISDFAGELCSKLQQTARGHNVSCKFDHLMMSADKAIPLGLLINELVTNAAKHAYSGGSGEIQVSGERRGADLHVEVLDHGIGLPKDFGNPRDTDRWEWCCGFYPGEYQSDTAPTFAEAHADFEREWRVFLSKRTEASGGAKGDLYGIGTSWTSPPQIRDFQRSRGSGSPASPRRTAW